MKTVKVFSKAGLVGLTALALLVACAKNSGGGGSSSPNVCAGVTNSPVCINGNPISGGIGGPNNLVNAQFQTAHMNGMLYLNSPAGNNYGSPTVAVMGGGTMQIMDNSYCGAPPGNYNLTMTTPANYSNNGLISGINLVATGPVAIQMYGNGIVYNINGQHIDLSVQLVVNGMPCGPIETF